MQRTKSSNWLIPYCFVGALAGIILTTGHSPAAQLRYDTAPKVDYGEQFQRTLDVIRDNSVNVEGTRSEEELFNVAIDAILKKVGDEHGRYYSPEQYRQLNNDLQPKSYAGIGVELTPVSDGLMLLSIFDKSALHGQSIKIGDVITAAGSLGEPLTKWDNETINMNELVAAIKGPVGSDVVLNIKRDALNLQPITVQRVLTRRQYVFMRLSNSGILTMRMTQFSGSLYADTRAMMEKHGWITNGGVDTSIVKGVVLDLRNNGGGVLRQAVYVSDLFLPKSTLAVRVIERPIEEGGPPVFFNYTTDLHRMFPTNIPRVVLINGGSASASEIVAGAVQVHDEALVMGTRSYGKGSVQSIIGLPNGAAIKTTSAKYLAGGSMKIDGIGVAPDAQIFQPDTIGTTDDAIGFNSHVIRTGMDPEIDHQLNVAHTYITYFLTGEHALDDPESRQAAENKAYHTVTNVRKVCVAKGLRGCPSE